MPRARISACLIVQNERERLPAALASVAFCDEAIVVDGGSTDGTVELARAAGAQVIESPWRGFAIQRNIAIDAAGSDWILEVDADERVSPALRASIEALLAQPPEGVDIAVCALRNHFLGGLLGPSAKYPAYRSRLFRRGSYRHDESLTVHEGLELRELPMILSGDLEHELAATLREALHDMWSYARLESRQVARPRAARAFLKGIVLRPAVKLGYRTIVDGGWRDGWRGLLKISLDVGSDALVWTLVLLRRDGGPERTGEGEREGEHFGRRRAGPARILAVAGGGRSGTQAAHWLGELQARGADVALICEELLPGVGVPQRPVARLGPLAVVRALELERQVRTIDAVVPFGRRARLVQRLLPHTLRPELPGLRAESDPERACELIWAALASI
jgi:Glycosyl transferase family 2